MSSVTSRLCRLQFLMVTPREWFAVHGVYIFRSLYWRLFARRYELAGLAA